MPNVAFERPEYRAMKPLYTLIADCMAGEAAIKKKGIIYLPKPNPEDTSKENAARYNAYITRAVFYNVAQNTAEGMVGQIFLRSPVIELPPTLDFIKDDATGSGVSLEQALQKAAHQVLPNSRAGLYVDYPHTGEDGPSLADIKAGKARPTIQVVTALEWINWRYEKVGAQKVPVLIVFKETYVKEDDGFETKTETQYRELRMVDGIYRVRVWRARNGETPHQEYFPKTYKGEYFDHIPFKAIGTTTNEEDVDNPNMYAICSINIGHYRNSADYEESVFMLGQPTPVFSGLTEEWVKTVLKGTIVLGARSAVPLPVGGDAKLLQAEPNTMAKEAMEHKEGQMLALGAKLVEASQIERTATESTNDKTAENSVLAKVASNIGSAFVWAIKECALFVGEVDEDKIKVELNKEFDLAKLTPEERMQLLKELQANGITFTEYRQNLRRAGVATLSDKDAKEELDKAAESELANAVAEAEGLAQAQAAGTAAGSPPEPASGA